MAHKETHQWLERSEKRKLILMNLAQPMTALQLSQKTGFALDQCSMFLGQLALAKLVKCLNHVAKRSRLYWLTPIGILCQKKFLKEKNLPSLVKDLPDIDWELYGWICYSHRAAIIRALTEPMQPSAIKRKIRQKNLKVKISANNVRDVIRLFRDKGIVRSVRVRKEEHLRFELTDVGKQFQQLLIQSGMDL
jgi:hypothetical protein